MSPTANWDGFERRCCPNCRLYFDVAEGSNDAFCSNACQERHERGELKADGGRDKSESELPEKWPELFMDPDLDCNHAYSWDSVDGEYICMYCDDRQEEPLESSIQAEKERNRSANDMDGEQ